MKTKFRIGLFLLLIVIMYLVYSSFNKTNVNPDINHAAAKEESVPADSNTLNKDCYFLYDKNGYVVVYLSDRKTPYEYTDILVSELPANLRIELRNGKYIENLEELYGFLENYSS